MQISSGKIKCNWEPTKLSTVGGSTIGSLVGRDSKEEVMVYWENKGQRQNNHKMLGLCFREVEVRNGAATSFSVKMMRKNK